jgi:hypothetical protein
MKKLLSTLALVLAISSVSMAKSSNNKKHVSHKKSTVTVQFYCDYAGHIIGAMGSHGTIFGSLNGCAC